MFKHDQMEMLFLSSMPIPNLASHWSAIDGELAGVSCTESVGILRC